MRRRKRQGIAKQWQHQLAFEFLEPRRCLSAASDSVSGSITHLSQVMDQFHNRFPVYDDVSSAGNHFHALGIIGDDHSAVSINGSSTTSPHSGATAIRSEFRNTTGLNFGGFYFQNGVLPAGASEPQLNFGTVANAGIDLSGATALTFWARGEQGGETIEFFMGGVGRDAGTGAPIAPYPDSSPRVPSIGTTFPLTTVWQQFTIPLAGRDLSYVLGGFAWVANAPNNPNGAVFYLDDIQYELSPTARKQRLNEPRFLASYVTAPFQSLPAPVGDFDLVLRNSAFTYDNALAILAFLADGSADSLRRARLIGDALVYASQHDRSFSDGRLRSDYAAGDIALPPGWTPNGRVGTVPVPGFFDEAEQRFFEIEQGAIDTGNNAWAMIALLALYRRTGHQTYLETAETLGNFIRGFRNDTGTYQGFQGGINNPEAATPERRPWASSEHNLDVHAAFSTMFDITGNAQWQSDAQHAREFVLAMWDAGRHCFLTGTADPETRNTTPGQLPLDVQAWSTLSLPDALLLHPDVLDCAETHHRTIADGFSGFDFNEDKDGVWFEGTAQMAVAYSLAGQPQAAESIREELRRAQQSSGGGGTVAASRDGLSTGFGFNYFRRLHIGATSWNVFAQLSFNPFVDAELTQIDNIGVFAPDPSTFFLRNSQSAGVADVAFRFGPLQSGWTALAGDWDGDRQDTVGLYKPATGEFFLRNENAPGIADLRFQFGPGGQGWVPIVGDWNGDGLDTIGLFSPGSSAFFLKNSNQPGVADVVFAFGPANASWQPIVGDWNNDGIDTVGLYAPEAGFFFLRNQHAAGPADVGYQFGPGNAGWLPLAGDWNGDGTDTAGVYAPGASAFFLRNEHAPGLADVGFVYGPAGQGWRPVIGNWHAVGVASVAATVPVVPLTEDKLQSAVDRALAHLAAAGLDQSRLEKLRSVHVAIVDLANDYLTTVYSSVPQLANRFSEPVMFVDIDAAGSGWSIEGVPVGDNASHLSPAGVDLLMVVLEEFGDLLELDGGSGTFHW